MKTMSWTSRHSCGYILLAAIVYLASYFGICLPEWHSFIAQTYLELQARASNKDGSVKTSSSFLKDSTTTLRHTIIESEQAFAVAHINGYLGDDPFLKNYLPLDPASNDLFDLAKDGVLLW